MRRWRTTTPSGTPIAAPPRQKGLHELERSSDSLRSLAAIAELVEEIDWRSRHPKDVWVDATL